MLILIRILIFTSIITFHNLLYAETNVVFLDMNKIYNEFKNPYLSTKNLKNVQKIHINVALFTNTKIVENTT